MNPAQIESFIRIVLAAGGPIGAYLLAHGFSADTLGAITTFLAAGVPVAMAAWGWWSNRKKAQVARVEAMPEVKMVTVDMSKASPALKTAALDDANHPKVQPG